MDPFQALSQLPKLIADYKQAALDLAAAQREIQALTAEKLVPLEWVADHWSVDTDTARKMIQALSSGRPLKADIKVLSYGRKIVRYGRSDIERITEINMVGMKDMLAQKRSSKA
ncbi:hypothetical protein [Spirosoma jeollabukense]